MAGDWIKMRVDLGDDPAVIGISEMLGLSEDTVVGKLHRLWSWADKHTTSGSTNGVTLKWVDRFVASQGFAEALCKFNWLKIDGDTLIFPNFDRHNGASAKARVEATLRQRLSRKNRDEGVTGLDRVVTPRPFVKFVHERDGNRCVYCGHIPTGKESLGVDHILPLTRGGKDAIENLVSCCNSCNNEKNDRTPEEFGLLPTFLMPNVTYVSQQICDKRVTNALPEKRREEKKEKPISSPKGSRFPEDSILTARWGNIALEIRTDWTNDDVRTEFEAFKDFWIAKPGKDGVKLDWLATWRNWCRNSKRKGGINAV